MGSSVLTHSPAGSLTHPSDVAIEPSIQYHDPLEHIMSTTRSLRPRSRYAADDDDDFPVISEDMKLQHERAIALRFGSRDSLHCRIDHPLAIAIDPENGHFLVSDKRRVSEFSRDGTFVRGLGGRLRGSLALSYDSTNKRIAVADEDDCICLLARDGSAADIRLGARDDSRCQGSCAVYDPTHDRYLVCRPMQGCIDAYSAQGASLGSIAPLDGERRLREVCCIAVDSVLERILALVDNHVVVLSSHGKRLFKFGGKGVREGRLMHPCAVAVYNGSAGPPQYIVCDTSNHRLQAFTHEGHFISSFGSRGSRDGQFQHPKFVAIDPIRGELAVTDSHNHRVQVIGAGRWLSFPWRIERHRWVHRLVRKAVLTMTMIRSLEPTCVVSLLPNELLFEIFQYLG